MSDETTRALEAILLVADEPVEPQLLAQLLEVATERVEELCDALAAKYESDGRGFMVAKVGGGYRFQTHPDMATYVERFVLEGQSNRLSTAALETLAIVAYKQPVSRAQVASIRGVNVDGVMRTLQHRGYVEEVARDPGPGQAVLYGTSRMFLERLGLNSLDELPPLAAFVPGPEVVEALEEGLRPTGIGRPGEADVADVLEDDDDDDDDGHVHNRVGHRDDDDDTHDEVADGEVTDDDGDNEGIDEEVADDDPLPAGGE